ncbi:Chemotaxis protein CheY [Fundidesulfovibrio magnetotacticus]|uniref:Chemotaxis protein CheY n=1 Tax=Fundidesulfovibrio magnetotacticus TaxID=2730080 RepID=A0A6V8M1F2_9BACT|nr:tetratricopeptide repeat protein [Fundidesulfovibrio magnetotacticus]GFK95677.1 Chemotaxis protein CheY [Fundidesulfovibrio magnetotacticus]
MQAARTDALPAPLRTALVVSASEGHARVDRISLKNARIPISRAVKSGKAAVAHLLKHGADVVLVDDVLEDGSGWDFVRFLRSDARLRQFPVILVSSTGERENVVRAIRMGCSGYLVRPYTLDTFFRHLALAGQNRSYLGQAMGEAAEGLDLAEEGRAAEALPLLEEAVENPRQARALYEQGMRQLAKGDYTRAVESFTQAARVNKRMAEAYLGLARCWLALGDGVRYRKALTQAAGVCAEAERFERYKEEFLAIIASDSSRFNPFTSLGMRLGRAMDWDGALMALRNAVWLNPDDAKAHLELAKAYHFKREPELAKQSVSQALTLSAHDPEAFELYERWTGRPWGVRGDDSHETQTIGRVRRGPDALPAVLNGVLYLAGVVTEGIHRFRRDYA